jgi:hypothetical protein
LIERKIFMILKPDRFKHYIDFFNEVDKESLINAIDNEHCWEWMLANIPWFECPDQDIEQIYYFRWWTFRKHLQCTPAGFVITEFLPVVGHGRKYNTIACAAALHIEEGRWLRNRKYVRDYARFWFSPEGEPRRYSNWLADAVYSYCTATNDWDLGESLLSALIQNYADWEHSNLHESGLFFSIDVQDGGEYSISGNGLRPTLNSYMYADAVAIAKLARRCGQPDVSAEFEQKAAQLKALIQERLWDPNASFFKTIPLDSRDDPVTTWDLSSIERARNVREIYGFLPWKFLLPDSGFEAAWQQIRDPQGFSAPFGPTTAEQRHPRFMKYRIKRCQWDGPSWPFTTSLAISALGSFLRAYHQDVVSNRDFLDLLKTYARSQHRRLPYGEEIPWIGENLHPQSGIWLARAIALEGMCPVVKDMNEAVIRGKDYNHSSYCNLVISDLIGFRPDDNNMIHIQPLVPDDTWDWFCLDGLEYQGNQFTIIYDKTGEKYGQGQGLQVFADGTLIGRSDELTTLTGTADKLVAQHLT